MSENWQVFLGGVVLYLSLVGAGYALGCGIDKFFDWVRAR